MRHSIDLEHLSRIHLRRTVGHGKKVTFVNEGGRAVSPLDEVHEGRVVRVSNNVIGIGQIIADDDPRRGRQEKQPQSHHCETMAHAP